MRDARRGLGALNWTCMSPVGRSFSPKDLASIPGILEVVEPILRPARRKDKPSDATPVRKHAARRMEGLPLPAG
jgi:hypothetical protein